MLDRFFRLTENQTNVRTELVAGLTTFLTMAYIIFLQPMILSGSIAGGSSGPDYDRVFGAVTTATCLAAALATLLMAFYARYPIAQAPGMGENFFFVATVAMIAQKASDGSLNLGDTAPWQVAFGVIFIAGLLFILVSVLGVQAKLLEAISPSIRNAIAVAIGLFIAFIGLRNASLVLTDGGVSLNPQFASPDLVVFFFGLLVTAGLHALRVRGSIVWGILAATALAVGLKYAVPHLPYPASFPKAISHRMTAEGLSMTVETSWQEEPGSQPLEITIDLDAPAAAERSLAVELLMRRDGGGAGPNTRAVQDVRLPPGTDSVHATLSAPELAKASAYAINVLEDGRRRPELSQPWTPLPTLPALVTQSQLITQFQLAEKAVSKPPSMAATFLKMDLVPALSLSMIPFILIFLFMDVFDTLGTLIGVSEQAGLIKQGKLPRMKQALVSDAVGTAAGAALGTSTVTSFIESAAGVEQGGRTGLTALVVAVLFVLALFFSPIIAMVGSYPPITAPALVVVGSMMMRNVTKIDWSNYAEAMPSFLIIIGIPLTYSIGDGLALGFIAYPIIKLFAGQGRDVKWLMYVMAVVLIAYFVFVRAQTG